MPWEDCLVALGTTLVKIVADDWGVGWTDRGRLMVAGGRVYWRLTNTPTHV
jgi:hypothetical protein